MFRVGAHLLLESGHVFQSTSFRQLTYLGRFDIALECLCQLMPDEIIVTAINGDLSNELKDHSTTLDQLNIPLIVSGGASNIDNSLIPFERAMFNSALFDETALNSLRYGAAGLQSYIGYLPFILDKKKLKIYESCSKKFKDIDVTWLQDRAEIVQEFVFLDAMGQGHRDAFNERIVDYLPIDLINRCYFSGGIGDIQIRNIKDAGAAGIVVDNVALYSSKLMFEEYNASLQ